MRFLKPSFVCGIAAWLAAALQPTAFGASHPEVLVVYNTTSPDSLAVANHYMSQRNIPASNLCAITPPGTDLLSYSDYTTTVQTPIQNCLNTLGQKTILYIVMTYMTPFSVYAGPEGVGAIDSYLADIWNKYASQPFLVIPNLTQPYYADSQSQGNYYAPFQSFATYRANARNPLIYSVWRLDGPSAAIASALVDQAISAEASGVPGQVCIDEIEDPTALADASYPSGDWDLYKAASFLSAALGAPRVTVDDNAAEFGTPPAPLTCPITGFTAFYSGWYSLYNYNNAFAWQTGSIGWHLDSESALSPRSGPSWVPNALQANLTNGVAGGTTPAGIAVTSGSVSEPYLQGFVRPGGAFRNLLEGASVGDAFLRNTRWLKWEIMYVGDPLYKPFGAGLPPFSPLQPVNSFLISPQEIVGGGNSTGTVTLSAAAPTAESFALSAPSGITVPPTVTVAAGATKASFPITTAAVTYSQFNVINAASTSLTLRNTITTDPLLGALVPSLSTTMAGFPISVTAILNGPAPTGGAVIGLSSDNPAITVPPSVTIPAGSMVSAAFTAGSTPVSSTVTPHITGTYAGATTVLALTVVPGISSMDASPPTISVGGQVVIEIYLGTSVPAGNTATVQLSSSDPTSLPIASSITVPAGTNYGNFGSIAAPGSSGKTVYITATYGGSTVTVTVTIN